MNAQDILKQASATITERGQEYGHPRESFHKLARIWTELAGIEITASQCCLMLAALKITRATYSPENPDHYVDIAGYAALAGLSAGLESAPGWPQGGGAQINKEENK